MTLESVDIIVPVVISIVTAIGTFMVTKNTNKKELTMSGRKSLSEDEQKFRAELREAISGYKVDLDLAREEIRRLSDEVAQLYKTNLELTLDNKKLQDKVENLRTELQRFREGDND